MRRFLLWLLLALALILLVISQLNRPCLLLKTSLSQKSTSVSELKSPEAKPEGLLKEALGLLKNRKDKAALDIFEKVLIMQPDNLDALWGKAEVLRRNHDYKASEELLNKTLGQNPAHQPSLITLSYIRYKEDRLNESLKLINQVLDRANLDKGDEALAYVMLGTVNSRRALKGGFLSKLRYGTKIKCYFLKARELSLDSAEVHLGLGSFYLLAPAIYGGNLNMAIDELGQAVKLAPDFATANARLAQAYKRKGLIEKYNLYLARAKELDPANEALKD